MSTGVPQRLPAKRGRHFAILPTTYLGKWAVGLAVAGVVLVTGWSILPLGGVWGLALELVGGVVALVAIFGREERALSVFTALLPFLMAVVFLFAELFFHA